jgi:hypothetical protein
MQVSGSYVPCIWPTDYVISCEAKQRLYSQGLWSIGLVNKLGILG